jgi:hypothetical protein
MREIVEKCVARANARVARRGKTRNPCRLVAKGFALRRFERAFAIGRIDALKCGRLRAEAAAHIVQKVIGRGEAESIAAGPLRPQEGERALVGIGADQQVDVVRTPRLQRAQRILAHAISVYGRLARGKRFEDSLGAQGAQFAQRNRRRLVGGRAAIALGVREPRRRRDPDGRTLDDGAPEQMDRARRRAQALDEPAARRLARDRHVVRVAAESRDVLLYPRERRERIGKRIIAGGVVLRFGGQRRMREVTERAEPVVDRDHHDAVPGE